jgi:hypothetical protein
MSPTTNQEKADRLRQLLTEAKSLAKELRFDQFRIEVYVAGYQSFDPSSIDTDLITVKRTVTTYEVL